MANYRVTDTELTGIANAIRTKGGTSAQLQFPNGFIDAINALPSGGPSVEIVPFSTGTDEQIAAIIDAAHSGTLDLQEDAGWAVGDTRLIEIGTFLDGSNITHNQQSVDIVLTSFDEYMGCGNVVQFDFKDTLASYTNMNNEQTNVGGYGATIMKTITLPALVNALPSWLKNSLIEFSVLASKGNNSAEIETVAGNKLALRSEVEVMGSFSNSKAGEGISLPYYAETQQNRLKQRGHNGYVGNWYTRSPASGYDTRFCTITSGGSSDSTGAASGVWVAPFGCL